MTHIVAVDGGGSRCRLAVFNDDGSVCARISLERHASLSLGSTAAWQHIDQGLNLLRKQLGVSARWQPAVLCMGLAGSLQQERRREFMSLLPAGLNAQLHTDGYAQLIGATDGQPGICLAVGTGSVMHWLAADGSAHMAGGWGFPVGDQGSGAWLGLRLLQTYIKHRDESLSAIQGGSTPIEDSALFLALQKHVGKSVSELQRWTTQSQSSIMAQLAPLVFEASCAGDPVAHALIDEAVEHCLALIKLAPYSLPVHIAGGVGTQLSPVLRARLAERHRKNHGDALRGLWRLAKGS